jgi:hypothetical protein
MRSGSNENNAVYGQHINRRNSHVTQISESIPGNTVILLFVLIIALFPELGMEKRNACRVFVEKLIELMPP